ncbi:hypothetical protein GWI33_006153, partial [Rhynchophorus ferrugineus]
KVVQVDVPAYCRKCHKWYKNARSLTAHIYQDCGKAKNHVCEYCQLSFKRRHNLKTHIMRRHFGQKTMMELLRHASK